MANFSYFPKKMRKVAYLLSFSDMIEVGVLCFHEFKNVDLIFPTLRC